MIGYISWTSREVFAWAPTLFELVRYVGVRNKQKRFLGRREKLS